MSAKPLRERPQITIIGAGRLGTALAIALNRKHYPIESLVSAHLRSAKKAAGLLDASTVPLAVKDLAQREPTAVVIISTPDDQIDSVVKQLEKLSPKPNRFAIHTSGAIPSSILAPLRSKNCIPAPFIHLFQSVIRWPAQKRYRVRTGVLKVIAWLPD